MVYQGVTIVSPLSQPQALFRPANPPSADYPAEHTTSCCEVYAAALKLSERFFLPGCEIHTCEAAGILDPSGEWTNR